VPAPITDEMLVAYAQRLTLPLDEARERAERIVAVAVDEALVSGAARIDVVPREFEQVVRARWRERVEAGESPAVVLSGTSGLPLAPMGGTRGSSA